MPDTLRLGETSLPASVIASVPWPVTQDHYESGDWHSFRRRAWWSLASCVTAFGGIPDFAVLSTSDLRDLTFDREDGLRIADLVRVPLLILTGSTETGFYREVIWEITRSLLRRRRFAMRPTWCWNIVGPVQLPAFQRELLAIWDSPIGLPAGPTPVLPRSAPVAELPPADPAADPTPDVTDQSPVARRRSTLHYPVAPKKPS